MKKTLLTALTMASLGTMGMAQENYKYSVNVGTYEGNADAMYPTQKFSEEKINKEGKPLNVILFIGDGMGTTEVFAGMVANGGQLFMTQMPNVGYSLTQSADNFVTDSSAGGTALSCGQRTRNNMMAMTPDTTEIPTILELSKRQLGKSTGLISTSTIVHATPGSFIAHVPSRSQYEDIALAFTRGEVDFFLGGGQRFFRDRTDGRNLYTEMGKDGFRFYEDFDKAANDNEMKQGILLAYEHMEQAGKRQISQAQAVEKAISVLKQNDKGFFMMVEGSGIDWGGHQNDSRRVIGELLDMDHALGAALRFAAEDGNTLIVVTADHETGGMSVIRGDMQTGTVIGAFNTGDHSAVMVPVFAFGPGAENFRGVYQNVDVFNKIADLMGVKH